jgi:ribokinase
MAAANFGANVALVSAVGSDEYGSQLLTLLDSCRIDHTFVHQVEGTKTSLCEALVNSEGEVAFVWWRNEHEIKVTPADIQRAETVIEAADALLVTLEVPFETVTAAVQLAERRGVKVFLNPAPPLRAPGHVTRDLLQMVDVVIPNLLEAEMLLEGIGQSGDRNPTTLASRLAGFADIACITAAQYGCVVGTGDQVREHPGFWTRVVDTTGGSDAFIAGLVVGLLGGESLDDAIFRANAAGVLTVEQPGGSTAMPTAEALENFVTREKQRRRHASP